MINYFNFKKFDNKYLITNDLGYYMFIDSAEFNKLILDDISVNDENYSELTNKGFIFNTNREVFLDRFSTLMFDSKNYLFTSTSLHIFVVTNICNVRTEFFS